MAVVMGELKNRESSLGLVPGKVLLSLPFTVF